MSNPISGILIDPEAKTVTEVELVGNTLDCMYKLLKCNTVEALRGCVDYLPGHPADDVWIDDDGLYSGCPYTFELPGIIPVVGRGLILGWNNEGETVSHTLDALSVDMLKRTIIFGVRREVYSDDHDKPCKTAHD